jgi:hypothetical protein
MICTTQYHNAAIMQEQYSGTIPQAAGNFGQRMLQYGAKSIGTGPVLISQSLLLKISM